MKDLSIAEWVLILVLMEYALEVSMYAVASVYLTVLILVLMEYALEDFKSLLKRRRGTS